jgi:hypothetical protein
MSLSQLRPLGFGEILDGSFTLYRRHFSTFVATSVLAHVPVLLLWLGYAVLGGGAATEPGMNSLDRIVGTLAAIVAFGALTRQASAAYLGEPVTVAGGFRAAGARFRPVWASLFIQGVALVVGLLLLVVPGLIFFTILFAMVPAVVLEGLDSTQAQRRSKELARGAWRTVFGVLAVVTLITWLPVLAAAFGLGILAALLPQIGLGGYPVVQLGITLALSVALPLQVVGTVILYYDRRVRTEALDLELAPEPEPAVVAAF